MGISPHLATPPSAAADTRFMRAAIQLAIATNASGGRGQISEVPIAAIVVLDGKIIGRGTNKTITDCDPTAHAEIVALRAATKKLQNPRLVGASLYVTKEPCVMCAGAMLQARIARLVFAVRDKKFGAAGGALNLLEAPFSNHKCRVVAGVEAERAGEILTRFFAEIRAHR